MNEPDKEVLKEMDKAETEVFDSMAGSVIFLLNLGFDIKTIEQMIQSTLESVIEQVQEKLPYKLQNGKLSPKDRERMWDEMK